MATRSINENLKLNKNNWNGVKLAIEEKGVSTLNKTTTEYPDLIRSIKAVLEEKNITPSKSEQIIEPSEGVDGFNKINVSAVDNTIDSNIKAENIKKDVNILGVVGTLEQGSTPVLQDKTVRASQDAQYINADDGYDGLGTVTIEGVDHTVDSDIRSENIKAGVDILGVIGNYSGEGATYQSKEVDPTTSEQNISADVGYDALSNVKVKAVTAAIDSNIVASNIKKDVEILGVTGTYEETFSTEEKIVNASKEEDVVVTPSLGKDGLSRVTINKVVINTEEKTVDALSTAPVVVQTTAGKDGMSKVTVSKVTAAIDSNIVAENIKKDVEILGVTGTYESKVGHCTPKHKDAAPEKNYRRVTTFNNVDDRRAIYFKDQVHVFLDNKHWIFDEETESLINEETVAALDGAMGWNYIPVVDDAGEYMYLMSYANWSGFGYLVRYDGTTFERIGAQDKPHGEIIYFNGMIYVNRGDTYYTIDVTDGTKGADTSKDSSISWMYSFVKDGKIYNVATDSKDVYEIDIANMTQSVVMTLPYASFKSTFYIDNNKEWIYTTLGPLNNDHLIRFKITGEVEEIGTGYSIGTNYGGRFMCTIVTDKKVWLLWYFMEQMAVLSIGKNVIAVPRDATRLYEGCTESDVKVTESGDLAILEIPEDANYLVYDDNNVYGFNIVEGKVLTASGLKLNGVEQSGGLVDISALDYYIMER